VLDREARAEQFLAARLALLQSTRPALEALYATLSPEQRAFLDRPWQHGREGEDEHEHKQHNYDKD
jgi:hypothetical protein